MRGSSEAESQGRSTPASHTCAGPAKALSLSFPPGSQRSGVVTVTAARNRRTERWPRKEAPHPRLTTPEGDIHSCYSAQHSIFPGRGQVPLQPWSSDPPWHHHRRPAVSRARTKRSMASLLHPPGPGWQDHRFLSQP